MEEIDVTFASLLAHGTKRRSFCPQCVAIDTSLQQNFAFVVDFVFDIAMCLFSSANIQRNISFFKG